MDIEDHREHAEWYVKEIRGDNTPEELETLTRWLAAGLAGWETNVPGQGITRDGMLWTCDHCGEEYSLYVPLPMRGTRVGVCHGCYHIATTEPVEYNS